MGLDMYFYARKNTYESFSRWDRERDPNAEDKTNYPRDLNVFAAYIAEHNFKSCDIIQKYQIGYFRKFNALHQYIVDQAADGEDNCQVIFLDKEDVEKLYNIMCEILKDNTKAPELLPTAEGFFFGSTQYDDWYFQNVENARDLFNMILQNFNFEEYELAYQASW